MVKKRRPGKRPGKFIVTPMGKVPPQTLEKPQTLVPKKPPVQRKQPIQRKPQVQKRQRILIKLPVTKKHLVHRRRVEIAQTIRSQRKDKAKKPISPKKIKTG